MLLHLFSDKANGMIFLNKEAVCRYLDGIGIEYSKTEHPPAFTIAECKEIEKIIGGEICKNLLLTNTPKSVYFLLLMKGDKAFVTKDVSKKLGSSRLSFASGEEMKNLLCTQPGSLSITSLIFDKEKKVKLAVDSDLLKNEYLCCHPSDNSATLKIKTDEIFNKLLTALEIEAQIIDI